MKSSRLVLLMTVAAVPVVALAQGKAKAPAKQSKAVAHGEYLVRITGCNDCHTPMAMGPQGPAPDMSRMLSGHPEAMKLPPAPQVGPGPWLLVTAATNTAWAGPWGVTYAMNLTPDATGMGSWTEKNFIDAMRSGKHMGSGRPILPPMPWQNLGAMTDEDLKAMFAYLKSIPAIKNQVPDPTPPSGGAPAGAGAAGPSGPSGPPAGKAAGGAASGQGQPPPAPGK